MAKNTLPPSHTALLLLLTAIITTLTTPCAHAAPYGEPTLTIHSDSKTTSLSLSELQQRSDRETLVLAADPVYGERVLSYTVIPIHKLFEGFHVPSDSTLLFTCLDGFSAPLSAQKLLNSSPSTGIAYLAIEDPKHPWPTIKDGKTAGPFYMEAAHLNLAQTSISPTTRPSIFVKSS